MSSVDAPTSPTQERLRQVCEALNAIPATNGTSSVQCAVHEDSRASMTVSVGKDGYPVFDCKVCETDRSWLRRLGDELVARGVPADALRGSMRPRTGSTPSTSATPQATTDRGTGSAPAPPTEQEITSWSMKAQSSGRLRELARDRGLDEDVLVQAEIGWFRATYVIPVHDIRTGEVVDYRRYRLGGKVQNRKDAKGGRLYAPVSVEPDGRVLFLEGEWDQLAAWQHGLNAVGWTGGATNVPSPADLEPLRGLEVVVLFDCDDAGRRGAAKWAEALAVIARSVSVADLDPSRTDGYDVRDWFNEGRTAAQLHEIIQAAQPGLDAALEAKVSDAVERIQVTEEAKRRVRELSHPPVALPRRTLADLLNDPTVEPAPLRVTDLHTVGYNTTITAQYKTGKTTLIGNLVRALADDKPFLGRFDVVAPDGRIGVLNYELTDSDQVEWLRALGIVRPERIAVLNLRGVKFSLATDAGCAELVQWCRDQDVETLVIDPHRRAFHGFGEENSNDDVNRFTAVLDEIKKDAGVADLFLAVHTGRGESERARGATSLDDWADQRWFVAQQHGTRFLRADGGRLPTVPEFSLDYDPDTRVLTAGTGTRSARGGDKKAVAQDKKQQELLHALRSLNAEGTTSVSLRQLREKVGGGHAAFDEALKSLEDKGIVLVERGGPRNANSISVNPEWLAGGVIG